jgi:putative FmdB family regulatory protein
MPIYAYKCNACGFAKDVLQKISAPLLTDCPACGEAAFSKQLTAAGFQLKGSGWYATDFKGGSSGTSAPVVEADTATDPQAKSSESSPVKVETAASTAGGCGEGCACHS